jgi:hypothetical protein
VLATGSLNMGKNEINYVKISRRAPTWGRLVVWPYVNELVLKFKFLAFSLNDRIYIIYATTGFKRFWAQS